MMLSNITNGPTRPMSIMMQSINFPNILSEAVIPVLSPTVLRAETVSKRAFRYGICGSLMVRRKEKKKAQVR